jgi:hypothetical protein
VEVLIGGERRLAAVLNERRGHLADDERERDPGFTVYHFFASPEASSCLRQFKSR